MQLILYVLVLSMIFLQFIQILFLKYWEFSNITLCPSFYGRKVIKQNMQQVVLIYTYFI